MTPNGDRQGARRADRPVESCPPLAPDQRPDPGTGSAMMT
jgi:hypothetical protein